MRTKKEMCGIFSRYGANILLLLVLIGMLSFTGCDPMESDLMKNQEFADFLGHFGYTPWTEPSTEQKPIWLVPCQYTEVTSQFGEREHPVDGTEKLHEGIDLAAKEGTEIYASRAGTVVYAGWDSGSGGIYVSIDHGDGYKSQYMHMTDKMELVVKKGQYVQQGELIGYVGQTGVSTGPHLHFVIRKYNENTKKWDHLDPALFVEFSKNRQ